MHIVSARSFTREWLEALFERATRAETQWDPNLLSDKVIASVFLEPSTRTRLTFEAPALRLGAKILSITGSEGTSLAKGESIEDTIRMLHVYSDCIVIRSSKEFDPEKASKISRVPVINAGDGANEHPTQSLVDLYTIRKEFGKIDGLRVAMMGDLKHGRTVHSLALALNNYDVEIDFVSPSTLRMPPEILKELKNPFHEYEEREFSKADVVYVTRPQKERLPQGVTMDDYSFTLEDARKLKDNAIILHPLPRVNELSVQVDATKQARYFQQAANAIPLRLALLEEILKK